MSNDHIPIEELGEGDVETENKNESSVIYQERTIPIHVETSSSSFISGKVSTTDSNKEPTLNKHASPFKVNMDSKEEFNNSKNTKNNRSYSQVLTNMSGNKTNSDVSDYLTDEYFIKRVSDDNCWAAKQQTTESKNSSSVHYKIKPLNEVRTEQHVFYEKFRLFKGRFNSVEELEARLGRKAASEKIVFIVDCGTDDKSTPFYYKNKPMSALNSIKRIIQRYTIRKSKFDELNEFAIILLGQNLASLYLDFTKDINVIQETISQLAECSVEDIFDFNSLFEILTKQLLTSNKENFNYINHAIFFYNRSYTIPEYNNEKYKELLSNPNLIFDIVMTHEPVGCENNVHQITDIFKTMINLGDNNMIFPVGRDKECLRCAYHKILGHPHQRPWQIRH